MMSNGLTIEEKATNHDTWTHIHNVQRRLLRVVEILIRRAHMHDQSKLMPPEVSIFTEFTPKLAASTYGSPEYEQFRKEMGPALAHHYAKNSHHPEHYKDGINDMDLLDLVEMLCDWKAATERHNDGNINKSLEINAKRFGIETQLAKVLDNTLWIFNEEQPRF